MLRLHLRLQRLKLDLLTFLLHLQITELPFQVEVFILELANFLTFCLQLVGHPSYPIVLFCDGIFELMTENHQLISSVSERAFLAGVCHIWPKRTLHVELAHALDQRGPAFAVFSKLIRQCLLLKVLIGFQIIQLLLKGSVFVHDLLVHLSQFGLPLSILLYECFDLVLEFLV